jgi:hypothetical protein
MVIGAEGGFEGAGLDFKFASTFSMAAMFP